ncbi:porin [Aurantivibrio plasticivorans]
MKFTRSALSGLLVGAVSMPVLAQDAPSVEELWEIIQKQQAEIDDLKGDVKETDKKIDATADAVETAAGSAGDSKLSIGGYGEVHYNNLQNRGEGAARERKEEVDIHRFVLFFNYAFSDSVRFFSEVEIEHALAGEGKNGEVEIEQAFIEWDLAESQRAKAGVFLVPVGILNETHEPNTFYGVERNNVEKNIIPSTWWEAGLGLSGEFGAPGLSYDIGLHSGLESFNGTEYRGTRSGRKKVSEAPASDLAGTGRIKYTGVAGLELSATLQYQNDVMQGAEFVSGSEVAEGISATLLEAHAIYNTGPFSIRALYAQWDLDDDVELLVNGAGADKQKGWYVEPSFKVTSDIGVFARYSVWDTAAGDSADSEYIQTDIGINYWLTPEVVFKADYQLMEGPDAENGSNEFNGFNLGVGWAF